MDKIYTRGQIISQTIGDLFYGTTEDELSSIQVERINVLNMINFTIDETLRAVRQEIAEYSGINDIQTKELINIIKKIK